MNLSRSLASCGPAILRPIPSQIITLGTALCVLGIVSAAKAAEVGFQCPAGANGREALGLSYDDEVLSVSGSDGTAELPASLDGDVGAQFGISGFGPAEQMMPDPRALDACLAAGLKSHGSVANDEAAVAYELAECQATLAGALSRQSVDLHVTATVIDPGAAMVFIQRTYQAPSTITGAPLTLDEFPTRDCPVQ